MEELIRHSEVIDGKKVEFELDKNRIDVDKYDAVETAITVPIKVSIGNNIYDCAAQRGTDGEWSFERAYGDNENLFQDFVADDDDWYLPSLIEKMGESFFDGSYEKFMAVHTSNSDFLLRNPEFEKALLLANAPLALSALPSLPKTRLGATSDNALHVAMRNGDLDEAKRLIEEDGDLLDAVNHENKRPLQVADVHAVDKDGNTALHYAAAAGTKSDVMDLVQRGADLDAQNHLGNAPIDWAQQVENDNTLETLDDLVQRSRGISLS
ncbi:MAG: ankyrin repeat domain-containing protein [Gallionella sp.]